MIKANATAVVEKPSKIKLVGKSVKRKEDYEVLVGRERYTADYKLPHMLYAAIYRSPYAHARIIGLGFRWQGYSGACQTNATIPLPEQKSFPTRESQHQIF